MIRRRRVRRMAEVRDRRHRGISIVIVLVGPALLREERDVFGKDVGLPVLHSEHHAAVAAGKIIRNPPAKRLVVAPVLEGVRERRESHGVRRRHHRTVKSQHSADLQRSVFKITYKQLGGLRRRQRHARVH